MTWLLVLVLLWPLLWLFRLLAIARILLGLEIRSEKVRPVAPGDLPNHLRIAADRLVRTLEPLGFQLLGGWLVQRHTDPCLDTEAIVMTNADGSIRAIIRPRAESARSGECLLVFQSTSEAGIEFITTTHAPEPITPFPAALRTEVVAGASPAELLATHRARLSDPLWLCTDLQSSATREQYICDAMYRVLRESGMFTEHPDGMLEFKPVAALQRSRRVIEHAAALKKARKGRPPEPPVEIDAEVQVTFDEHHYRQMIALTSGRMSRRNKSILTVVSLLAFAGVLAWQTSPVVAITLLVALIFHEGGHLVGMWVFGYKDTQLLFIPFFGGAAVGHDDKVLPPWQHVVIVLLGPLPGIFVGLALVVWQAVTDGPAWLTQVALTTLILNAFNLLPIMPMDGGQIVDYAVASRFPRVRVLFYVASALGLVLVGWLMPGVTFLVGLGVVMLMQLKNEWRLAELRTEIRAEYPEGGDEPTIVRRLLVAMREPSWTKTPMPQRLRFVRMLQNVLRTPRPGFGTLCFAVAGYTAPLWFGLPIAAFLGHRGGEVAVRKAEAKAGAAGVVLAKSDASAAANVRPEDNAGVPYAKAEALAEAELDAGAAERADHTREIVALLREAAQKPVFVPVETGARRTRSGVLRLWTRGMLPRNLLQEAEEKIRYGEPAVAISLIIDALRLVRLLDSAPVGWFSWAQHDEIETLAWGDLEQALAAGAKLTAPQRATLLALADENVEITFASTAIPQDLLRQAHAYDEFREQFGGSKSGAVYALLALESIQAGSSRERVRCIEQAVALRDTLRQVAAGSWPEFSGDLPRHNQGTRFVAQLGDLIARQRQVRVALAWIDRTERGGGAANSLPALGFKPAILQHPYTRQPLQLARRGSIEVLAFASTAVRLAESEDENLCLIWRLPSRAR